MFYTNIYQLTQFVFIALLYFVASLIDNIHISLAKRRLYLILSLVFIIILAILTSNFNRLVSNNWSISKESMYALILKGLSIHGPPLKFFSLLVPYGCPFYLLPVLVGLRYNYLDFSLKVVKLKTKFCSSPNFSSSSRVYYYLIKLHQWRNRLTLDIVGNLNAHTAGGGVIIRPLPA